MNIENHFRDAHVYLAMAKDKFDLNDFVGAQAALAKAYSHTREILDHVQTLIVSTANVELSAGQSSGGP